MIFYKEKGVQKKKAFTDMDAAYAFGRRKKNATIGDVYPWNIGYDALARKMRGK